MNKSNKTNKSTWVISLIPFLSIILCIGMIIYIDYPDFEGLKSISYIIPMSAVIWIIAFSLFIGYIAYALANRQAKIVSKLKAGDNIGYNGNIGTLKSVNKNRAVIEIEVPLMSLNKGK